MATGHFTSGNTARNDCAAPPNVRYLHDLGPVSILASVPDDCPACDGSGGEIDDHGDSGTCSICDGSGVA